ncbi:cytospin-A isoform X2 [Electrophorus electricus]|uniref:cytospin-A isoform X2 n=1 Tax=Electrophorus electricus TaxID=8005 RepID=UPI0015CF8409|nr:cytospin-A isoform X2 [Electrophorus electricus]
MGNYSAKERNGAPGSPLDLYHSPPISPQTLTSPGNPTHSDTNSTSDRTSSPVTDPASTAIGPRGRLSLDKTGSVSVKVGSFPISPPRHGRVEVRSLRRSLTDTTPTERSQVSASPVQVAPPTVAWSDPGAQVDRGLLQECVVALGLSTAEEKSHTLTDILKCFLSEREQMKEELRSLMEKIQNNNLTRERLTLDQQDNLVNLCKDKKEENPSLPLSSSPLIDLPNKVSRTKPSEDLNTLLRRHGGSKRNSLLRWCQARTNGYQNIEITNFSSSWVDGLAFCAVYHTYLPTYIPYNTLSPENKRENLLLAFQTGQEVGIAASLTVEEMMKVEGPDWQRVLGYVESVYRHFEM